jgi:hypothetical protein
MHDNLSLHNHQILPDDYEVDDIMPRKTQDHVVNTNGQLLIDFLKQSGLRIANGRVAGDIGAFTFIGANGSSLIDYCLVDKFLIDKFKTFNVSEPNILSDHCLIQFSFQTDIQLCDNDDNIMDDGNFICIDHIYKWDPSKREDFLQSIQNQHFLDDLQSLTNNIIYVQSDEDIDNSLSNFVTLLKSCSKPFQRKVLNRNVNSNETPSLNRIPLNDMCTEARRDYYYYLNVYRKNKSDLNRCNMVRARTLYKNSVRNFNITRAQENTKSLISARFKNAKLYWKLLKEGVVTNKPTKISCDTFLKYFEAINNPSDVFFQPDEDVIHFNENFLNTEAQIMFKELDLPFTSEELKSAISELSNGRSAGPDGVINEILIHGYYAFEQYLLNLFNKILESGYFPNSWSEGYIVPVHKKGSMDDVNNFRGITLLSTIGKLFTKLLNKRLSNWAEDYYVYTESQAGFRSKMGTNDNIFVLHGLVQHMINKNEALYCSFIDFSKCFDYLVHHNIWFKLTKLGIRGKIYTVIKSMYNCIKSRIKLENRVSTKNFECLLGVRQGESLSPFLFTMYVNDLEEELYLNGFEGVDINNFKMFLLLYADDIVLLSKTPVDLQNGLNILENYCQRWKLKVNIEKTKIMVFGKGRLPNNLRFTYGGQPLEIVNKFCYLGIVFTRGGSFVEAQNTLDGQAQKAIYKMKKYLYRFTHIGVKHTMDIFDKLIVPILHYGCQTWGQ